MAQVYISAEELVNMGLYLGGLGHLEALIEVDVRPKFSVLGLDGVFELWFQIGNRQFTEKRERGGGVTSLPPGQQQITLR